VLTCRFDPTVMEGIYPYEDVVLIDSGVYLGNSFHHWNYLHHLEDKFKVVKGKKAKWKYDWKGPKARCWCLNSLYSPSQYCGLCQNDLNAYVTLKKISADVIREMSRSTQEVFQCPSSEQQKLDLMPQDYDQVELTKVVHEQAQHKCFYCGRQSHLAREKRNAALPFLHSAEVEEEDDPPKELNIGTLTSEQHQRFSTLIDEFHDLFVWEPEQIGRTNRVYHTIDVGDAKPI
jgi:hypothetical protein